MLTAILVSLSLSIAAIFVHYEMLRLLWMNATRLLRWLGPRGLILTSVIGTFLAHAIEVIAYALVFWWLDGRWGVGQLADVPLTFDAALTFSAESYATLGVGTLDRHVPLRLLAGTEALTGLLLVTWSASFTYLVMRHGWRVEQRESHGEG